MVKVIGPALSLDAHKSIGKTLTYQQRPSGHSVCLKNYPGSHSPASATPAQLTHRAIVVEAITAWNVLTPAEKKSWDIGTTPTGYNRFLSWYLHNVSVPPVTVLTQLLGSGDISSDAHLTENTLFCGRFVATVTGPMTEFRIKLRLASNIKCGLYSSVSNFPSVRLAVVGSVACNIGWNTISFPSTPIVKNTVYWMATNSDVGRSIVCQTLPGTLRYRAFSFASAFPNPAGSFPTYRTWTIANAGWGYV